MASGHGGFQDPDGDAHAGLFDRKELQPKNNHRPSAFRTATQEAETLGLEKVYSIENFPVSHDIAIYGDSGTNYLVIQRRRDGLNEEAAIQYGAPQLESEPEEHLVRQGNLKVSNAQVDFTTSNPREAREVVAYIVAEYSPVDTAEQKLENIDPDDLQGLLED